MLTRRGLIGTLLAAPVIIRTPGLLMPVKAIREPLWMGLDWAATMTHYQSMALFDAEGRLVEYQEWATEISNEALPDALALHQNEVTERAQALVKSGSLVSWTKTS